MDSFESHYEDALNKLKELYPEDVDNVLSGQYSRILDSDEWFKVNLNATNWKK